MDPRKPYASVLLLIMTRFNGVLCFAAGSGKSVLWFVDPLMIHLERY
jgi:hypothetical protein